MRVAILGNRADSFIKPMAEGLQRMLSEIGVESQIFYDGLQRLKHLPPRFREYVRRPSYRATVRRSLKYWLREVPAFFPFVSELRKFDVVVVVNSLPDVFLKDFFQDEILRRFLPRTSIVLYDLFYLPTRGHWAKWLRDGNVEAGIRGRHWGLERYDWYLCASVVSECPMPEGRQPYSLIGLNLADGTLKPERKDEFIALLDFEQPQYLHERATQVLACEETGTKYIVLNGNYPISKIRELYRKCSIYFLASRESFGLPICELQACGSYVFTPFSHWCPSHWLKKDLTQEGPGELSPNFIVYHDDMETLVKEIERIKTAYDPQEVVQMFHRYHPQLMFGDLAELKKFIRMVEKGQIHSKSHEEYSGLALVDYTGRFSNHFALNKREAIVERTF